MLPVWHHKVRYIHKQFLYDGQLRRNLSEVALLYVGFRLGKTQVDFVHVHVRQQQFAQFPEIEPIVAKIVKGFLRQLVVVGQSNYFHALLVENVIATGK